jgi:hypothetical protein
MDLSGLEDPRTEVGRLTGQQTQLADEPPRPMSGHHRLRRVGGLTPDDVHLTRIDEDQVIAGIPSAEQQRAGLRVLRASVCL